MWRVYLACDWLFGYYVNSVGIVCFFIFGWVDWLSCLVEWLPGAFGFVCLLFVGHYVWFWFAVCVAGAG